MSFEMEELGGNIVVLEFEDESPIQNLKIIEEIVKLYVLLETFENKIKFESPRSEHQFDDLYYHHSGRVINIGSKYG